MALQTQAFGSFTPSMFATFVAKIEKDTGVKITTDKGHVVHGSFEFDYDYNRADQLLHTQCTKKPMFLPAHVVLNGMSEEIAELRTATLQAASDANENIIKATQDGAPVDVHGRQVTGTYQSAINNANPQNQQVPGDGH
jgi:hypothetical protein